MMGVDREQAALYRIHTILMRLSPLIDDMINKDLVDRAPESETRQLEASLKRSLEQMEMNLSKLGFPSDEFICSQKH